MMRPIIVGALGSALFAGAVLAGRLASAGSDPGPLPASGAQVPATAIHGAAVLVELFQSQGCSSCPPANANLNALADRPGIIALSFGVTYWDYLGWRDTFATPQNTARQRDYARFNYRWNVATPQVWINGRSPIVGSDPKQLAQAIDAARATGPALRISGRMVTVPQSAAGAGGADVWLARYDPKVVQTPVRAGENGGRTLPHKNIVRQLIKLGHWTGAERSFRCRAVREAFATQSSCRPGGAVRSSPPPRPEALVDTVNAPCGARRP